MAKITPKAMIAALRARDLTKLKKLLRAWPKKPLPAGVIVEAGRLGYLDALKLLAGFGADWNSTARGYRALHALIQEKPHHQGTSRLPERLACLRWLLKNGADPEQPGAWPPARAILVAAFVGQQQFVDALREGGAKVDGFSGAALGDLHGVQQTLTRDRSFARARDNGGLTALQCCAASRMGKAHAAARDALQNIAALLLDAGADPNAKTKSWGHDVDACYFACNSGQAALFELLLKRGADANAALPSAAWQKTPEMAAIALRHGADPNESCDGDRPLLNNLIRWGQFAPAAWLLEHGASPNVADGNGWTAMHQAASRGNEKMMRALLRHGGDATVRDGKGFTPLKIAFLARRPKLVSLLSP